MSGPHSDHYVGENSWEPKSGSCDHCLYDVAITARYFWHLSGEWFLINVRVVWDSKWCSLTVGRVIYAIISILKLRSLLGHVAITAQGLVRFKSGSSCDHCHYNVAITATTAKDLENILLKYLWSMKLRSLLLSLALRWWWLESEMMLRSLLGLL